MSIVLIKVGSAAFRHVRKRLTQFLSSIRLEKVVWVISGAIMLGNEAVEKPVSSRTAAAIGQPALHQAYTEAFHNLGRTTAQVLVSIADIQERKSIVQETIMGLLSNGIVPLVNENDVVAEDSERTKFDNDYLAARLAHILGIERVVILSNIHSIQLRHVNHPQRVSSEQSDGSSSGAQWIDSGNIDMVADLSTSDVGRGGIGAKVSSARWMAEHSIECHVAHVDDDIERVLSGRCGTTFRCDQVDPLTRWSLAIWSNLDRLVHLCWEASAQERDPARSSRSLEQNSVDSKGCFSTSERFARS